MISSIARSLFPSFWLNQVLGRYNANLLDRHFGEDKKHRRIAHSVSYSKAIKSLVAAHNKRADAIKFAPLKTKDATESEKILLSHALIGEKLIAHGTEEEQLKGFRFLNITKTMITNKIQNNQANGLLLPDILRLIGEATNAFMNTSIGQAFAAENN